MGNNIMKLYYLPQTAIEAEILFAARVMQVRFLGAVIKPVHPCTGLIARFAQQNALLLEPPTSVSVLRKKHRGNKTAAVKRLERKARCRYLCTFT